MEVVRLLFYPTYFTHKVTDIKISILKYLNIQGIILDVDDTLIPHQKSYPKEEIISWIQNLKSHSIKVALLSNNFSKRIQPLSKNLEIEYVSMGMKPLTFGLKKTLEKISCSTTNSVMVGDQIFTDVLAANLAGVRSILVDPLEESKTMLLKFKRLLEKNFRERISNNNELNLKTLKQKLLNDPSSEDELL